MNRTLLFSIGIGAATGIAVYWVSSKKKERVKEAKADFVVDTNGNISRPEVKDEPETFVEQVVDTAKRVKASIKRKAKKIADWIVDHQDYLEAAGVCFGLATSAIEFKRAVAPVTPIQLSKKQVEDVVRTTFDGYLDVRSDMLKSDVKEQGVQEFLDYVANGGTRIMKNSVTGDSIEMKVIRAEAA